MGLGRDDPGATEWSPVEDSVESEEVVDEAGLLSFGDGDDVEEGHVWMFICFYQDTQHHAKKKEKPDRRKRFSGDFFVVHDGFTVTRLKRKCGRQPITMLKWDALSRW